MKIAKIKIQDELMIKIIKYHFNSIDLPQQELFKLPLPKNVVLNYFDTLVAGFNGKLNIKTYSSAPYIVFTSDNSLGGLKFFIKEYEVDGDNIIVYVDDIKLKTHDYIEDNNIFHFKNFEKI